jgi:predicted small lipoprotein YifL
MRNKLIARCLVAIVLLTIAGCGKSTTAPESGNSANSPNSANSSSSSSSPNQATGNAAQSAPAPTPPPPPPPVVIPAGAVLTVTLDQTVNSKTASNGDSFVASLAEPVTVGGSVVLPPATKVTGTIVRAQSAGRFNGNALLQLTLDSLKVNGTPYSIQTTEFEDAGKGRGKRTAIGAGGGAAFGAIVGALAGGGKGAAIGALAGGGAGTAGAAFTGKKDIVLPAETRLHFKLAQPVSITVSQ